MTSPRRSRRAGADLTVGRCTDFVLVSAYLGAIDGVTRCRFWAEDPTGHGFDPERLIGVDLARTPSAAAAGRIAWDEVEVDDAAVGANGAVGGTSIGPAWPALSIAGAVYLARRGWAALPARRRPRHPPPGAEGRDYEYAARVYWTRGRDPRAGRRYVGHHATLLEARGGLAHVAIYPAGRSRGRGVTPLRRWLDLTDVDTCDAGVGAGTTLSVHQPTGALFLCAGRIVP